MEETSMTKIDSSEQIDHRRRRLLGAATVSVAVAQLGLARSAPAQSKSSGLPPICALRNVETPPLSDSKLRSARP
jgi:hypothetical protein